VSSRVINKSLGKLPGKTMARRNENFASRARIPA
jgi:hypothetical protein